VELAHWHHGCTEMTTFLQSAMGQMETALNFQLAELKVMLGMIRDGRQPIPADKKPEPVQPKVTEQVPTERAFTLRVVRWVDAHGIEQVADQYTDCNLTLAAAARGKRCHAVTGLNDPRRRELLNAHGGRHPNRAQALDLNDEQATRPPHAAHIESVLASGPSGES